MQHLYTFCSLNINTIIIEILIHYKDSKTQSNHAMVLNRLTIYYFSKAKTLVTALLGNLNDDRDSLTTHY